MSVYTPEQVPVLSSIAKGFATFDHWFCEVPSQTFTNRSFYHAGSASGLLVNVPYDSFPKNNDAETVFERLDAAGLSWRVYVDPGMPMSITGMIHTPRLHERFATQFSTHEDFFDDAEHGRLPTYSFIEPNLLHAHIDYHPVDLPALHDPELVARRRAASGRRGLGLALGRARRAPRSDPLRQHLRAAANGAGGHWKGHG